MWAPRVRDLEALRRIDGLGNLRNRAVTERADQVHPELSRLSEVMVPAIEQVQDRVYSAVGFDSANTTFVVGDGGVIVIDAMTSIPNLRDALIAFRDICQLPIVAVVYTHSHGDHWAGSPALFDASIPGAAELGVPIIAHRTFLAEVGRINGVNQPVMGARGAYQFGVFLPATVEGKINMGAGPFLAFNQPAGLVPPTTFVDETLDLTISGVDLHIEWVPSEAPDEIVVWMPGLGVLQSAECVQGECYPNLYTLRGDVPRPAAQWISALDRLRTFPADALAKSHGRSVVGAEAVAEHLLNYRDVIAWTHDQTIRRMNQGLVPDQIVEALGEMPPHLRAYETTGTEGYGTVSHGSRAIYNWYLGFNTGEVTAFDPAPYEERQRNYVAAMGGSDRLIGLAEEAIAAGRDQWAIEILGYLVRSEPGNDRAREMSAAAHRRRGFLQHNAVWRNWYLTAALELEGSVPQPTAVSESELMLALPTPRILAGLTARLRAEDTLDLHARVVIAVVEEEKFGLELRRGVLEVGVPSDDPDVALTFADKAALVDYLSGTELESLHARNAVEIDGDRSLASSLAGFFEPAPRMDHILVTLHGTIPNG